MVIELLPWLLNCCVVTELIVFSELYTKDTNRKKTVSSIRLTDVSVTCVQTPPPPLQEKLGMESFLFATYPPDPLFNAGRGGLYTG